MANEDSKKNTKIWSYVCYIKYVFSFVLIILAFTNYSSKKFLLCSVIELMLIILFSNQFLKVKVFGKVVNSILCLMFNTQMAVMFFGSSFLSYVMLTNLDSLEDISGNSVAYIFAVASILIFSILPINTIPVKNGWDNHAVSVLLVMELVFALSFGNAYSPMYGYIDLARKKYENEQQKKNFKNQPNRLGEYDVGGVTDARKKPEDLPEKPNVIVILAEGLSQNIVDDPRDIMTNVRSYESKSLNFEHYYNHTFATYRGIIGQLYSGYQLNNFDENTLVSAQELFGGMGYKTTFINTEPNNAQYTTYLENMGFDEIVGTPGQYNGEVDGLSDKEAYSLLSQSVMEDHDSKKPFFTVIYTFGTHASFRSPDAKFAGEDNPELDKFYNMDIEFGNFMEEMEKSGILDDTIVVFTADHATYADKAFNDTFPDHVRVSPFVDEIPLLIYYKGVKPETIDAKGRNSLDMIPTLFDYLDVSLPNYFLGITLFNSADHGHIYDTIFTTGDVTLGTDGGAIAPLSESREEIFKVGVEGYYIAKKQRLVKD